MDATGLSPFETALIHATQTGLPLQRDPYQAVAAQLGCTEADVLSHLQLLLARGVIRRIGVVPNHYALGFVANGMTVWDVEDAQVDAIGAWLGALPDVTHCYRRPRHLPLWRCNLFAMLHGKSRPALQTRIAAIAAALEQRFPNALRHRDVLFSSAILKKTGLRLQRDQNQHAH